MSIRVRVGEVTLEADTEEELAIIMRGIQAGWRLVRAAPTQTAASDLATAGSRDSKRKELLEFINSLSEQPREFLRHLLIGPTSGISRAELREKLGVDEDRMNAILSSITLRAKKIGLDPTSIYEKQETRSQLVRTYIYKLAPEARAAMTTT